MENDKYSSFDDLVNVMKILRSDKGCLWDRKQTHKSLVKYLKEESEELIENIENDNLGNDLKEELGDILLQVLFHSQIAAEDGRFDIYDVVDSLAKKLKFRHPHVFGDVKVNSTEDIIKIWKQQKKKEGK